MIKSSPRLFALLVLLVSSSSVTAQQPHVLTGPQSASGNYDFNGDVVIFDLVITGSPGATMKVIARDGSITVMNGGNEFGVRGAGANGVSGDPGNMIQGPTAGDSGIGGYSLSLETLSSADSLDVNLPIFIRGSIDLHGGSGGNGGSGRDAQMLSIPCEIWPAQPGAAAGNGGGGGSLTVTAHGDVTINKHITTSGGSGGKGGDGGNGGYPNTCGESGAIGGSGAAAGEVTITQNFWVADDASITMEFDGEVSGFITATGGNGGDGGAGGSGTCPADGSPGGAAGAGATVWIEGKTFYAIGGIVNDSPVPAGANNTGGNGGSGGQGGSGKNASCVQCGANEIEVPGFGGMAGGAGRNGESGGLISIACENDVVLGVFSTLTSHGGNGGKAGNSGNGGVDYNDPCNLGICEGDPEALAAGGINPAGNGGPGGPIVVFAWGTIYLGVSNEGDSYYALLDATGGKGGNGATAGNSGVYCCGIPPLPTAAPGVDGGAGGTGGSGGDIILQYFVDWDTFTPHFLPCGGDGGDGGNGGVGTPVGQGGPGGGGGPVGGAFVGGFSITPLCFGSNGSPGADGDHPNCIGH